MNKTAIKNFAIWARNKLCLLYTSNTTVEVLEKICLKLGCGIDDIMEIIPDSPNNGTGKSVE